MDHIRFEIRPVGKCNFSCIAYNGNGWVTFRRNPSGQIRNVAWTTRFSDAEFGYALKEAARLIEENELRVRASAPLGIHLSVKEVEDERRRLRRQASKARRRENMEELQKELDLFKEEGDPIPSSERMSINTTI